MTAAVDGTDFPETVARLRDEVDEALFTRGAQVAVVAGGDLVLDRAFGDDGIGRPMTTDTVLRVYCTIKPVTALAVGKLLDDGTLTLDTPVGDHVAGPAVLADRQVTVRHLLNHTAGAHRPMGIEIELLAPARRVAHADATARPSSWRVGVDAAYSEHYGWNLLGRLVEAVTGADLREHLRREVLDPLGLHRTWIGMTEAEHAAIGDRLGANLDLRTERSFPLLLERGRRMCTETNPAHGGYSCAADLARLYGALLRARAGEQVDGLPAPATVRQFTEPQRPRSYDGVLGRECTYGFGFMTDLAEHAFGARCPAGSFGHSGNVGSTFAFADPERDLAACVVFNGIVDPESAFLRRPALVAALYRDLDAAAEQADRAARSASTDEPDPDGTTTGSEPGGARRGWLRRRRSS